jgi:isopentenyl diphosphate isomerase/L-lactate dehydrogenase-like FMN-dependent dehydrogenase
VRHPSSRLFPSYNFCLVARPIFYGLAIAGQAGVEQILMQSICDLHITMGLCGYSDVNDLIGKRDELLVKVDYGVGTRTLVKSSM